ncbi:MAG: hypothetical protein OXB91_13830, partial [Bryobacterales bacterium]|nr:hypothetical protein [Bryobacterales bacterium]
EESKQAHTRQNASTSQRKNNTKRLFEYENIELVLDPAAMQAIARLAVERNLGARGLRMIMEDLMLELMYYLPSQQKRVKRFVVSEQMVLEDQKKFRARLLEKAG